MHSSKRSRKHVRTRRWWWSQQNSIFQTQQDWCTYELTETVTVCTRLSQDLQKLRMEHWLGEGMDNGKGGEERIIHFLRVLVTLLVAMRRCSDRRNMWKQGLFWLILAEVHGELFPLPLKREQHIIIDLCGWESCFLLGIQEAERVCWCLLA